MPSGANAVTANPEELFKKTDMTEVIMPKMGDGMEEGTLLEWLVAEGTKVKSGQVIGTIQTDKATLELEAPGSGILSGILVSPGETVPVGRPIAALLKEGESLPAQWSSGSSSSAAPAEAKPELAAVASAAPNVEAKTASPSPTDRIKASPLARRVAHQTGVDLASVVGSGPGGRIVERDVRSASPSSPAAPARPATSPAVAAEDRKVKLNKLRQITGQRTQHSKQTVPHFYVTREVDLEKLLALKDQFAAEEAGKVSVNDFIVRACVVALQAMPGVNASVVDAETLVEFGAVNIGIAVAVEDGLTVPVLHQAQSLSLGEIATRTRDLAARARENKLSMAELSGSTFSISNMGMLDVDNFAAIINEPNGAILAVSSARRKVVPVDGADDELEIRWRMNITASFDHRVVDGATGAKFVNAVRELLENPTRLLV